MHRFLTFCSDLHVSSAKKPMAHARQVALFALAATLGGCSVVSLESPAWPSVARGEPVSQEALRQGMAAPATSAEAKEGSATRVAADIAGWAGHYEGTLPCADCKGIHHLLTLNKDGSYMISINRLGSNVLPSIGRGQFTWNRDETEITLDAQGDYRRYRVGDGTLHMLTTDGKPLLGVLNEPLILKKRP